MAVKFGQQLSFIELTEFSDKMAGRAGCDLWVEACWPRVEEMADITKYDRH